MEKKSKVVVIPCDSYEKDNVYWAMKHGIEMLGGLDRFVRPEEKILVKPNFLTGAEPDRAVTTHPAVISTMLRLLAENRCRDVICGDSPGHGSCAAAVEKIGLKKAELFGAKIADMSKEVRVPFPEGITAKEFYFAGEVMQADAVINLCKMKTHALERITGAVKNVYGLICGYRKAAGHVKYPNASIFARMLADIHRCVKPRLHIMDGIVAMEGNGPGSGDPIAMNVLLFSEDPVALDAVFCTLISLKPELVPTNTQGEALGIGTYHMEEIEIIVPDKEPLPHAAVPIKPETVTVQELQRRYGNLRFHVDRTGAQKSFLGRYSEIMTALAKRPRINKKLCVKCGICVNHCPVPQKAVDFRNGRDNPPVYDYAKCIRCYCCQEMCPQHAITAGRKKRTS